VLEKMVPRDGVEPPTPAFSELRQTAKRVISKNSENSAGAPGKAQEPLMFLFCSRGEKRRNLKNSPRGWIGTDASADLLEYSQNGHCQSREIAWEKLSHTNLARPFALPR